MARTTDRNAQPWRLTWGEESIYVRDSCPWNAELRYLSASFFIMVPSSRCIIICVAIRISRNRKATNEHGHPYTRWITACNATCRLSHSTYTFSRAPKTTGQTQPHFDSPDCGSVSPFSGSFRINSSWWSIAALNVDWWRETPVSTTKRI